MYNLLKKLKTLYFITKFDKIYCVSSQSKNFDAIDSLKNLCYIYKKDLALTLRGIPTMAPIPMFILDQL